MPNVILDACCLINLLSSGRFAEILRALPYEWYLCSSVAGEALSVAELVAGAIVRKPLDLHPWFTARLLLACQPEGEQELAAYVRYAAQLDDGEAMCLAVAQCRSWIVATDDRKGRRVAERDGIQTIDTVQLIRLWVDAAAVESRTLSEVIRSVTLLGRYRPAPDSMHAVWWHKTGGSTPG